MAEVYPINTTDFQAVNYSPQDQNLILQTEITTDLTPTSCIELYIYDLNQNQLGKDYNFKNYTTGEKLQPNNTKITQIILNPENDTSGYNDGSFITYYNFLDKEIGESTLNLYIKEISSDRTEIRLDSSVFTPEEIRTLTNNFIQKRESSNYFLDFYLNFGNNQLVIANNIKLEDENTNNPTILVKLYESLIPQFDVKSSLWIVTTIAEPQAYQVDKLLQPQPLSDSTPIKGPNYNLPLQGQVNNSSQNLSYNDIILNAPSSSQNQINSLLEETSIPISVDYTNYSDFIHFSSAQTRIENFNYKVGLIENYSASISSLTSISSSNSSQVLFQNKISNIIKNFDKFEYFMYYNSGSSFSWPKTTSSPPYLLAKATSSAALTWLGSANESNVYYGGRLLSASNYDNANPDELKKSIPEYLREDSDNAQYDLFIDMVAQYYDNVWLYTKDITQKYNADNRLDFGISKELVSDAIKDFGVKLYQNNFSNKDLYTGFLGLTPEGATFPFPEITGSTTVPTGYEFVDTLISASSDIISMDDTNKSLYKRIYHNLPYLLKSKGTIPGLRALITSYGIPDTILKISEFGGKDQVNANDYDLYFNNFNYALGVGPDLNYVSSSFEVNSNWNSVNNRPDTIQFRFKSEEFPPTNLSQSLITIADNFNDSIELTLEYTGSGLTSGSYNGSIKDPYYQYATLRLTPEPGSPNISASVYLPFYNNDWWSAMITKESGTFTLYAANKIYNGKDGTSIGFISSSTVTSVDTSYWTSNNQIYFSSGSINNPTTYPAFSGSLQEIRYYNQALSESVFKDYVMNPLSFEGNGVNSAPNQLMFRAALGSELDITSQTSIHPKVTGSWAITSSFSNNSNFYLHSTSSYHENIETFFLDQPAAGIKNRITDKIRFENNVVPSGDALSPYRRVSQVTEASASYTDNINYLEVAFSPQNQINDDIISQIGYFNIGDYIGDPRQRFTGSRYEDLNSLSEEYFKKYIKQYDLTDFVRLIKFFDNSLFKMIKDFIPVRTSLASGLVVKQHLLERNKYPQPSIHTEEILLTGSINIAEISGGAAGIFNPFNSLTTSPSGSLGQGPNNSFPITQSWVENYMSISGSVSKVHDDQSEFYNGELSGSTIVVTNGELNESCQPFKEASFSSLQYGIRAYNPVSSSFDPTLDQWLAVANKPLPGFIQTFYSFTSYGIDLFQSYGISDLKISKIDATGTDNTELLTDLNVISLQLLDGITIRFNVKTVTEQSTYFYYTVENATFNRALEFNQSIPVADKTIPIYEYQSANIEKEYP